MPTVYSALVDDAPSKATRVVGNGDEVFLGQNAKLGDQTALHADSRLYFGSSFVEQLYGGGLDSLRVSGQDRLALSVGAAESSWDSLVIDNEGNTILTAIGVQDGSIDHPWPAMQQLGGAPTATPSIAAGAAAFTESRDLHRFWIHENQGADQGWHWFPGSVGTLTGVADLTIKMQATEVFQVCEIGGNPFIYAKPTAGIYDVWLGDLGSVAAGNRAALRLDSSAAYTTFFLGATNVPATFSLASGILFQPATGHMTIQAPTGSGFDSRVSFGVLSETTGILELFNASSTKYTRIQAGNAAADVTYTLPTAAPTATGMALLGNTDGSTYWGAGAPGGWFTDARELQVITDDGSGTEVIVDDYQWNADITNLITLSKLVADLSGTFKKTVGNGTIRVRIGGTRDTADGTICASITVSSATDVEQVNQGAATTISGLTGSTGLVKVTAQPAVGGTLTLRGLIIAVKGSN